MRHLSEWEKGWVDGMPHIHAHIHAHATDDRSSSWYWGRVGERESVSQGRHVSERVEGGDGAGVGHTFTHRSGAPREDKTDGPRGTE